jgi:hypothetical protein
VEAWLALTIKRIVVREWLVAEHGSGYYLRSKLRYLSLLCVFRQPDFALAMPPSGERFQHRNPLYRKARLSAGASLRIAQLRLSLRRTHESASVERLRSQGGSFLKVSRGEGIGRVCGPVLIWVRNLVRRVRPLAVIGV